MATSTRLPDPAEQLRLARHRAWRWGLRGPDLDDASQLATLAALDFDYDAGKANGASPRTALISVMDRHIKMYLRAQGRRQRRFDELDAKHNEHLVPPVSPPQDAACLAMDVSTTVTRLPARERDLCRRLSLGHSIRQIAADLCCDRHAIARQVTRLRGRFFSLSQPQL